MSTILLSQEQTETLQELTNIAMGQAGDSLARILDVFIELSVPKIRVIGAQSLVASMTEIIIDPDEVTAVRQAFYNRDQMRGEAITIFGSSGCKELACCMGYDHDLDSAAEQELLLDVSNVLIGAVLNGLAAQLATDLSYSAPSIIGERTPVTTIITPQNMTWNYALMVGIDFGIEDRTFKCHLLILMAEESIKVLGTALDNFLEGM